MKIDDLVPASTAPDAAFILPDGGPKDRAIAWALKTFIRVRKKPVEDVIRACKVIIQNDKTNRATAQNMLNIVQDMLEQVRRETGVKQ